MGTKNYDACVTHLKWAPCLTKLDWEVECNIVHKEWANQIMRDYHNGVIAIDEAIQRVKNNIGQNTFVRCVHSCS